ncbi:putative transport protein [Granulicella sibirica]|uniref:Putative transport protein n=2 Tax=Granulicella sibirica TaxID=2479048 RepID=A0A4Q0SWA7_9BACT|nr:putative transport protein [Granulicella sibirica]
MSETTAESEVPGGLLEEMVEAADLSAGAEIVESSHSSLLLPMIVGFALFMGTLDGTVISNALPTMARALHQDPLMLNTAITSYLLASAVFLPISGWAADRFGARTVFRGAIILFAVSSVGCGIAHALWHLVVARLLQGIAGSMMLPVGRLVLLRTLPKAEMVRAMGFLILPGILGTVLGPPVGGFIVTFSSWRWIFYINLPMGLIGAILTTMYVPNVRETEKQKLDLTGFLLTGFGLAGLVYGFENVGRNILPAWAVNSLLGGGLISLILFYLHYRRARETSILDLSIIGIPTYRSATVGGMFLRLGLGAGPFLLALLLQLGFGLSAFQAGLLTLADALGSLLTMKFTQPLVKAFGFKRMLVTNIVVAAILQACYAFFRPETPHWMIVAVFFVSGMFRSTLFTALNALAYADLPQKAMSRASSLSSVLTQLASSLGIGASAVVLHAVMQAHHTTKISSADITPIFPMISGVTLISLAFFLSMPTNAGATVSGPVETNATPKTA